MTDRFPNDRAEQAARAWFARQASGAAPGSIDPAAVRAAADRRQRLRFTGVLAAAAVLLAALVIVPMALRPADPPITGVPAPSASGPAWTATAPSPLTPRWGSLTAWLDGRFYVFGGWDGGPCPPGAACDMPEPDLRDGATYDPATDSWTTIAETPVAIGRGFAEVVAFQGAIYVQSVIDDGSFWVYHPDADAWQELAQPASYGRLVASSSQLVLNTYDGDPAHYAYRPADDTWAPLPEGPIDSCNGWSTQAAGERLLVVGRCGTELRTSFFDPDSSEWSQAAVVPGITVERYAYEEGGDAVYVAGSLIWPRRLWIFSSVLSPGIYDLESQTWREVSPDITPGALSYRGLNLRYEPLVLTGLGLAEANGNLLDVRTATWLKVPEAPVPDRWDPVEAVGPDSLLSCFGYLYVDSDYDHGGGWADGCYLLTAGSAATTSPTVSPAAPTEPPTSAAAETIASLTASARETALAHGRGRTPITAEAVATRAGIAEEVLNEGANPPRLDADVWVVQLRGQFVCGTCSRPVGADDPAGTVIRLVIPADGAVEGGSFTLTREPADLTRLGDVIRLDLGALELPPFDDPDPTATALADAVRPLLAGIAHEEPVSAEAGVATLGRAQQLVVGHTPYPPSDTPAWFVQLQGRFACADCMVLGTATAEQADVLILVLDQSTGERLMAAVSNDRFDLAEFGELSYLGPRALSIAPGWQPEFASYARSDPLGSGEAATLDGVLRVTGGCLVVESDAGPVYTAVLPTPATSWSAMDKALNLDGVLIREGDRVSWGGGYSATPMEAWNLPDACRGIGQEYFRIDHR